MSSRRSVGGELLLLGQVRPFTLSVYSSTIQGAATTPISVIPASAAMATVKIALGASSSWDSWYRTNSGTRVAVSTPPSSSS